VALLSYVEGRNTQDIDLIIEPETAKTFDWNAQIRDRNFALPTTRVYKLIFCLLLTRYLRMYGSMNAQRLHSMICLSPALPLQGLCYVTCTLYLLYTVKVI
jgi:hypothetical protein